MLDLTNILISIFVTIVTDKWLDWKNERKEIREWYSRMDHKTILDNFVRYNREGDPIKIYKSIKEAYTDSELCFDFIKTDQTQFFDKKVEEFISKDIRCLKVI